MEKPVFMAVVLTNINAFLSNLFCILNKLHLFGLCIFMFPRVKINAGMKRIDVMANELSICIMFIYLICNSVKGRVYYTDQHFSKSI